MARLPQPGSDDGTWGDILNEYLEVAHTSSGALKQASLITGAQQTSQKGQVNGYAGLDSGGKVPLAQLPIGDYIGVYASSFPVIDNDYPAISWDGTTTVSGDSLAFDPSNANRVQIVETGVYSITVTIEWDDQNIDGMRAVQIFTDCAFLVNDQRPSVNYTAHTTIQSVTTTLYLQPGDDIRISINQVNTGNVQLAPYAKMLVTRCA